MHKVTLLGWLVGLFVVVACSSTPKSAAHHKIMTIDELRATAQHTRNIEVVLKKNPPEYFSVILESQPGTGYAWREISNTAPAKAVGLPVTENSDKTPGGISETIFLYTATDRGIGVIEYEYRQDWEKSDPHIKKLRLQVTIK